MKNVYGLFISCLYLTRCFLFHFLRPAVILDEEYKRKRSALYNFRSCFVSSLTIGLIIPLSTLFSDVLSLHSPL